MKSHEIPVKRINKTATSWDRAKVSLGAMLHPQGSTSKQAFGNACSAWGSTPRFGAPAARIHVCPHPPTLTHQIDRSCCILRINESITTVCSNGGNWGKMAPMGEHGKIIYAPPGHVLLFLWRICLNNSLKALGKYSDQFWSNRSLSM